jgi:hypothetical protein
MRLSWILPACVTALACCSRQGPSLTLSPPILELGEIKTELGHPIAFTLKNGDDGAIRILDVKTSCGCTKPRYPNVVEPGQSVTITADYEPELLANGPKNESITVVTDSKSQPTLQGKFSARLQPPVILNRTIPIRVPLQPGKQTVTQIVARSRDSANPPFKTATTDDPRTKVTLANQEGNSVLTIAYGASQVAGDIHAQIRLSGLAEAPQLMLPFNATLEDGPYTTPSFIRVTRLRASEKDVRLATLSVLSRGQSVEVQSATASDPALICAIQNSGKRTWINVHYRGGWSSGLQRATIRVKTDHPKWPVIEVPVVATVTD